MDLILRFFRANMHNLHCRKLLKCTEKSDIIVILQFYIGGIMKSIRLFSVILLTFFTLTACNSPADTLADSSSQITQSAETAETTVQTTITTTETTTETTPPVTTVKPTSGINLLTGKPSASGISGSRPIAVTVNNIKTSLPQYGTSAADIIYEAPVEGGITRLLAIYENYSTVPRVCSIRSARYYFPLIANGMDAVYIHWGLDMSIAKDTMERLGINHFDGGYVGSPLFGRDKNRVGVYASEHTGYLDGPKLKSYFDSNKVRTSVKSEYEKTAFNFSPNTVKPPAGAANKAVLSFSPTYFSTFTYDTSSGKYLKQHSGSAHIDSVSGKQLAFENVFILKTKIAPLAGNGVLMDIDLTSGSGYYLSEGGYQPVLWSKADDNSPITFTTADGKPLSVNKGKSYIGIIGTDKSVTIS